MTFLAKTVLAMSRWHGFERIWREIIVEIYVARWVVIYTGFIETVTTINYVSLFVFSSTRPNRFVSFIHLFLWDFERDKNPRVMVCRKVDFEGIVGNNMEIALRSVLKC